MPKEKRLFKAQGQMGLLTDADPGGRLESDPGESDQQSRSLTENVHTGRLEVTNNSPEVLQGQFVIITWRSAAAPRPLVPPRSF